MLVPFYRNDLYCDYSVIPELEKEFAKYTGFKYGVAVNSCTNAIALCLEYEQPKSVTIPAMTYVSVANEILRHRSILKFSDECSAGKEYRLVGTDIVDSAHEVLTHTTHKKEDKFCYSFYPTKLVASYEGGIICTDDVEFTAWAIRARDMGRTGKGAYYGVVYPGMKCNITPIQAKYALKSLYELPTNIKLNNRIAQTYKQHLPNIVTTQHLVQIRVDDGHRFREGMKEKGVECSWHFEPLYDKQYYKKGFDAKDYPYCESIKNKIVSLPMFPTMIDTQLNYVIKCAKECL